MEQSGASAVQRAAPLDPLRIQQILDDLWREYRAQQAGVPVARARLANLISFCRTREESDEASRVVTRLNAVRPVRSIVVVADEAGGAADAEASLRCGLTGVNHVCFEEIVIHAPGDLARTIPSLVEPLTVTDLPVYLWFVGDPPLSDPGIERLLGLADRVVTDSHTFTDPLRRFHALADLVRRHTGSCVFTEMTWTRMGTWREAVGKLFDPMPSREFLPRIKKVRMTSARSAGIPSDRSLVMTGWLAARLGWKAVSSNGTEGAAFEGPEGAIEVTWAEGPPAARGHLLGITMQAGEVEFRVSRVQDDPLGAVRSSIMCSGDEQTGPAYSPAIWQTHELLCNALEIRTPFRDWEDALNVIAGIAPA
ncbi:MAG TPA: glucose-6-phosphate dehydrogenase assembly protein OpcA [Armatimonadota bacterium]|jgi:glucose-6-phosphate dehydrogenase assembly protein OpcA